MPAFTVFIDTPDGEKRKATVNGASIRTVDDAIKHYEMLQSMDERRPHANVNRATAGKVTGSQSGSSSGRPSIMPDVGV